jgi:hypothetical protein
MAVADALLPETATLEGAVCVDQFMECDAETSGTWCS